MNAYARKALTTVGKRRPCFHILKAVVLSLLCQSVLAAGVSVAPSYKWGSPIYSVPYIYDSFDEVKADRLPVVLEVNGPGSYVKLEPRNGNCSPADTHYTHQIDQSNGEVYAERYNPNIVCDGTWGWYTAYGQPVSAILSCPEGYTPYTGQASCDPTGDPVPSKNLGDCGGHCCLGNPINPGNGNKLQKEVDYVLSHPSGLRFARYYNSLDSRAGALGYSWRHTYSRSIQLAQNGAVSTATVSRPNGKRYPFTWNNNDWISDGDVVGQLSASKDSAGALTGWTYTNVDDEQENYTAEGRLSSIVSSAGWRQDLSYDNAGRLITVADQLGHFIQFSYDAAWRIATLTEAAGMTYRYDYDGNNNLISVTYPESVPGDPSTSPVRYYHYENASYPHALTGVTDERGVRYATYEYDLSGRAQASYHAGGAERVVIVYNGDGTREVTNSLGQTSVYLTTVQLGVVLTAGVNGPGCSTCGTGNTVYEYDPNTNDLLSETENNLTTLYGDYDAKGQYGYKIEAGGSPQARQTSYQYDGRFHGKAARVTAPSVYGP